MPVFHCEHILIKSNTRLIASLIAVVSATRSPIAQSLASARGIIGAYAEEKAAALWAQRGWGLGRGLAAPMPQAL